MIPKAFHFIFGLQADFGGKPFSFMHYMAIKSALAVHPKWKAFLYYEHEPQGICWEVARRHVEAVKVQAPRQIHGRPLNHVAHQADVLRLRLLHEHGGVYLDLDTITTRGFSSLLRHQCVVGLQGGSEPRGYCNAVLLSEPRHPFIADWLAAFADFRSTGRDEYWDEHAVVVPKRLADAGSYDLTVLPADAFFIPSWEPAGIADLFIEDRKFPQSLCHHLWETFSWTAASRIDDRNVGALKNTYARIAARHLGDDAAVFRKLRAAQMKEMRTQGLKLNLGCGSRRLEGWANADADAACGPDLHFDPGKAPWPLDDDSVAEARVGALEALGSRLPAALKELYRVCRHDARVEVRVLSAEHQRFIEDPANQRPVTPQMLALLDRKLCTALVLQGDARRPLALEWDVDFRTEKVGARLDPAIERERKAGGSEKALLERARHERNIIAEYAVALRARKQPAES